MYCVCVCMGVRIKIDVFTLKRMLVARILARSDSGVHSHGSGRSRILEHEFCRQCCVTDCITRKLRRYRP